MEYATLQDFETYLGQTPPDNAESLLKRASNLVAYATRSALYTVDENDMPVEAKLLTAMREATCVQANAWFVNNIDPVAGRAGADPVVTQKNLGTASVQFSVSAGDVQARSDLQSGEVLVFEAFTILERVGLISNKVQTAYGVVNNAGV
jgi:hypothetical protein